MADQPPYRVVESDAFLESVSGLFGDLRIWDDLKYFFENFVARNPYAFEEIPGTNWRAVTVLANGIRTLYFSIDESRQVITYEAFV